MKLTETHYFLVTCHGCLFVVLVSILIANILLDIRKLLSTSQLPRNRRKNCISIGDSDLQIGVRRRLRVRVLSSEHAHFENLRRPKLRRVPSTEISYS